MGKTIVINCRLDEVRKARQRARALYAQGFKVIVRCQSTEVCRLVYNRENKQEIN